MKLYYYKDKIGNFGDDLNVWLWDRLLPGFFDNDDRIIFVGIGTLLNSLMPRTPYRVVFSSGVGYKDLPSPVDASWKIYCVRGPLSASKLGISKNLAITDGAALLRTIDFPELPKKYKITFIPHHLSHLSNWEKFCKITGINYINPSESVDLVLTQIRESQLVIAEAMHGAIVADTFRVPWIPARLHNHILNFKWQDWCLSLGLQYRPATLPRFLILDHPNAYYVRLKYMLISFYLRRIAQRFAPNLSETKILDSATSQLQDKLEQFKKDYVSN